MKVLFLLAAALHAAPPALTPAQLAMARQEAVRTIEGGKVLLPQDENDPFTAKYLPRLHDVKELARMAPNAQKLEQAKDRYEAWKKEIFAELYPKVSSQFAGDPAKIQDYMQTRMNALIAAEHLNGVLSQTVDLRAVESLKARVLASPDAATLGHLYDNLRVFTPTVIMPPAPAASERSIPASYAARYSAAVPAAPVPQDYAKVSDYLVSRGASRRIVSLAISEAQRQGADPLMVLAVIQAESSFDPRARSSVGARGLMQIMPDTGRGLGVSDPSKLYDPVTNLKAGVRFLKGLWNQFSDVAFSQLGSINPWTRGDVKKAIAAYNAGPGAVEKYGGVPPYRETRGYVVSVLRYYAAMRRAQQS